MDSITKVDFKYIYVQDGWREFCFVNDLKLSPDDEIIRRLTCYPNTVNNSPSSAAMALQHIHLDWCSRSCRMRECCQ